MTTLAKSRAIFSAILVLSLIRCARAAQNWPKELGMHRAVVRVDRYAPVVSVRVPWRTLQPRGPVVVDAATGKPVANVVIIDVQPEQGDIAFEPFTGPGDYHVYYRVPYPEEPKPDKAWLEKNNLTPGEVRNGDWRKLPTAKFIGLEAASAYDAFTAMERVASRAETEKMLAKDSDRPYLLFPEDRKNPIRMLDAIPEHWAKLGPSNSFEGITSRGEFYMFQIGVYAARMALEDLHVSFEDLKPQGTSDSPIPATVMRCFNKNGTDWKGRAFTKVLFTGKEKVRPLWIGIPIPKDARPGVYEGNVTITVKGVGPSEVHVRLHVGEQVLDDAGDADLWRHARLRWLDSTIALDEEPTQPFTPVKIDGAAVRCLGRELVLGTEGLPAEIRSFFSPDNMKVLEEGKPLLDGPVRMVLQSVGGVAPFSGGSLKLTLRGPGAAVWESSSTAGDLSLRCDGLLEFDGYGELQLAVTAQRTTSIDDIRVEIPLRREAIPYMMGLGVNGGFRPRRHDWKWDPARLQDSVWLGDVNGGVRWQLLDDKYQRPLVGETFKPIVMPASWQNEGKGGVRISEEAEGRVLLCAFSGPRTIQAGQTLHFNMTLMLTPFKTLDMATHWGTRYYQEAAKYIAPDDAASRGVNVVNVHQGNDLNPYINYPFLTVEGLKKYVKEMHARGIKTKIYYTIRELSTRVYEMWALRSLDGEIFLDGPPGRGHAWMQDHLVSGYTPAWTAVLPDGDLDTSINTTALSRWHNYYLEGLNWLARNIEIDGLYLDGIGYNRDVMKRVRKVLDRGRPGSLLDWHNGNEFQPRYGLTSPANQYMEAIPYINRVWLGEMYDYGESPEYYLIEISGIPFGVMGEMINGNAWRGPVYGMLSRMGWSWGINDPRANLKLWDQFGIGESQMIGYWVPTCPVKPDHPSVRATVYRRNKRALIAMANWSDKPVQCRLTIDFAALGIDPAKARIRVGVIEGMQGEAVYKADDAVPIAGSQGLQVILEETP